MSSIKLLGSLEKHKYSALNRFLPRGYAVVATFPSKSRCEIKVAVRASEEELESVDKYFWNASSIGDGGRKQLHRSLTENSIPTGMIDGLHSSIESDDRLAAHGARKGKQYRSPDTSDSSGSGCIIGIITSIVLFVILAQMPIEQGWWVLLSLVLSIAAGILIYIPFQSSHSAEMQEIADEQKTVGHMGPRLIDAEFYASTVSATADRLRDSLNQLRDLGLATDESAHSVSSMLGEYFDSASELEKSRSIISSTKKVLMGLSESEIKSDPDLARVLSDNDKAAENKIKNLRRQFKQEKALDDMAQRLDREIKLANAKLNAVKYRYEKED